MSGFNRIMPGGCLEPGQRNPTHPPLLEQGEGEPLHASGAPVDPVLTQGPGAWRVLSGVVLALGAIVAAVVYFA